MPIFQTNFTNLFYTPFHEVAYFGRNHDKNKIEFYSTSFQSPTLNIYCTLPSFLHKNKKKMISKYLYQFPHQQQIFLNKFFDEIKTFLNY